MSSYWSFHALGPAEFTILVFHLCILGSKSDGPYSIGFKYANNGDSTKILTLVITIVKWVVKV
jgi:hypothetical protein